HVRTAARQAAAAAGGGVRAVRGARDDCRRGRRSGRRTGGDDSHPRLPRAPPPARAVAAGAGAMTKQASGRGVEGLAALRRLTDDDGPVAAITRARLLAGTRGRARRRASMAFGVATFLLVSGA